MIKKTGAAANIFLALMLITFSAFSCGEGMEIFFDDNHKLIDETLPVTGLKVMPLSSATPLGINTQLNAYLVYSDSSEAICTDEVEWQSLDEGIATVNAAGLVSGVSTGTAEIRAEYAAHGVQDQVSVEITGAILQSISITPDTPLIYYNHPTNDRTVQFKAMGDYSDSSSSDITSSVNWTSSNPDAAIINSAGLATADTNGGVTTIDAELGGISDSETLSVKTKIILISENFDAVWPPTGWTGNFGTTLWHREGSFSHNGSESANYDSIDDWPSQTTGDLNTPTFDLTGLEEPEISFWYMSKTVNRVVFIVPTDVWNVLELYRYDGVSWTKITELNEVWGFEDWTFETFSLPSTTERFRFRGRRGWGNGPDYDTHVDEVLVSG